VQTFIYKRKRKEAIRYFCAHEQIEYQGRGIMEIGTKGRIQ
jgi:hypothetical protein